MRKLEQMQLEGVAMADLDRVIGGVRIGSLFASDWLVTSAIGAPSASGGSLRARHDGFVGILGFLPAHGSGSGDGNGDGSGGGNLDVPPQGPSDQSGDGGSGDMGGMDPGIGGMDGCCCGGGTDPSGGVGGMPPGGGMDPSGGMGGMPPGGGGTDPGMGSGYGDPSMGGGYGGDPGMYY
jgi:hypothetical protein